MCSRSGNRAAFSGAKHYIMKTYKITYVSWNVPANEQHYFAALSAIITKALWQVVFPERDLMDLVSQKAGIEVKAIQFEEVNA